MKMEINVKAMSSAFYMDTGGFNVGSVASIFGIPGGYSFKRNFSRHSTSVADAIIVIGKLFIIDAVYGEIRATITENVVTAQLNMRSTM